MPQSVFSRVKISGITTVVPPRCVRMEESAEQFGYDAARLAMLRKIMGLNQRYVVDENTTAVDLCQEAAIRLFAETQVQPETIDAIIMVTQTPDYRMPASAAYLHGLLNLPKACAAFDVNLGCSGYVYGLWLAAMMIETHSASRVLLLAGDTMSKLAHPKDKSTSLLFGDAGAATLLEADDQAETSYFILNTDGKGFDNLIVPAGGFRKPSSAQTQREQTDAEGNVRTDDHLYMNGSNVFSFSTRQAPTSVREIVAFADTTLEQIDHFVFHQANKYILTNILRTLKLPPEKCPFEIIETYGNVSVASMPLTICEALQTAVTQNRKRILFSGFGVGLSWGTCIMTLDHIACSKVARYSQPQPAKSE